MTDLLARQHGRGLGLLSVIMVALGTTAAAAYFYWNHSPNAEVAAVPRPYASGIQIQYFCGRCHAYPTAETLPRAAWKQEVEQAYKFFAASPFAKEMQPPPMEDV